MNILAIDPGSEKGLGWAVLDSSGLRLVASGTAYAERHKPNTQDRRIRDRVNVWANLLNILEHYAPLVDLIAYEDVVKHSSVWAAHLYGGQIAHVQWYAHCNSKRFWPVPVQTVKRALGCKAAGKDKEKQMVEAAHRLGYTSVRDHNEADAVGIALGAVWLLTQSGSQSLLTI